MNLTRAGVHEILRLREVYAVAADFSHSENNAETSPVLDAIKSQRLITFHLPVEDRIVLDRAVERLADFERSVVDLFFYQDLTQTEIARRLGSTQRRISRILANTLDKLKEEIR